LNEHFPESRLQQSGTSILVSDLTGNMVRSLTSSILLAVLFIGGIMAWLFRSAKLITISLLPNLVPLFVTAGVMGYFGIDLKPSTAVIFTIAFGIAVDDTIHFLSRLRLESWKDQDLRTAIRITTEKTGRAILLTSAILLTGFGTLMTSDFTSTVWMGSLVSLTIFVALIADILFLPALLYWMKPDLKPKA
jgi:predicted RND superfamily exporter protein